MYGFDSPMPTLNQGTFHARPLYVFWNEKAVAQSVDVFANVGSYLAALFVQMGASLPKGGPAGLFLGFVIYGTIVLAVNQCFGTFCSIIWVFLV